MRKCRIEVIKTHFDEELAARFGCPNLGHCFKHKVGDVFYTDYKKPDGFCDEAWKAIYQYVFAIFHNSDAFYEDRWLQQKDLAICSCNDGLRPVIFKIDAVEQE